MAVRAWVKPSRDNDRFEWVVETGAGLEAGEGLLKALASAHRKVSGIHLVVPAADVTLHELKLRHKNGSVLAKALPFALEEHVGGCPCGFG